MRFLPALVLALAVASVGAHARASEPAKAADHDVRISTVGLPIVWRGRVVNYVFVNVILKVAPNRDADALRAKEPYFRDALVRAGHRTPFIDPANLAKVDERALDAALLRDAGRIAGPGVIQSVEVASQAPRQRAGLPVRPGTPAAQPARSSRPIIP